MPFTIKTVCTKTYDTRRFYVEEPISIEGLKERIGQIYGCEDVSDVWISYVDTEGDFVTIKTTEDVGIAVDEYKEKGVLKVFLSRCSKEKKEEIKKEKESGEESRSEEKVKCQGRRDCEEGAERRKEIKKRRRMITGYMMSKFCGFGEGFEKESGKEGEKEKEEGNEKKRFGWRRWLMRMGKGKFGGGVGCGWGRRRGMMWRRKEGERKEGESEEGKESGCGIGRHSGWDFAGGRCYPPRCPCPGTSSSSGGLCCQPPSPCEAPSACHAPSRFGGASPCGPPCAPPCGAPSAGPCAPRCGRSWGSPCGSGCGGGWGFVGRERLEGGFGGGECRRGFPFGVGLGHHGRGFGFGGGECGKRHRHHGHLFQKFL
jgi:hypothetical protein